MSNYELEESDVLRLDFGKLEKYFRKGDKSQNIKIMPVIVQDINTKEVLILGYANEEVLRYSLEKGVTAFWSTSRNELWVKGLTSGNTLQLIEVQVNCKQNSLLYLVKPVNNCGACHTQENGQYRKSCFYRQITVRNKKHQLGRTT
jgi:phosphoribosyl-AMP cyclohydrolase